jgi:copper transport protein
VTNVALGAMRALDYVSIALVLGALAFLLRLTPAALRDGSFERGVWGVLVAGLVLGVPVDVLGILLQAAHQAGTSLWSLHWSAVTHAFDARTGWVWVVQAVLLAASLAGLRSRGHGLFTIWLILVGAFLALAPALYGHAAVQSPVWAFFPADVAHVLAAGVWVGGIACVVFALPPAIRAAEPPQRTDLLVDVLARFSPVALGAVAVLAVTGVIQAYIAVRTLNALTHTTYGELVLLKIGLLGLLIGLGAINRERVIPTLRRLRTAGAPASETGVLLARTTRGELATMACVFAVTAALLAYTPPVGRASAGVGAAHVRDAVRATPR